MSFDFDWLTSKLVHELRDMGRATQHSCQLRFLEIVVLELLTDNGQLDRRDAIRNMAS